MRSAVTQGLVVIALAACRGADTGSASTAATVSGARIAVAPPTEDAGEWRYPARDYASSRYSPLAQITPGNAKNLHVSWTFSTGVLRGHEGQPLVVDKTMYLVTPF